MYQYMPHELVIHEVDSIYKMIVLPPVDLRKLCDKMFPINDKSNGQIQQKGKKVSNVMNQLEGKEAIDLKSEKQKQKLFKAIDQIIANGLEEYDQDDDFFEKVEINKNSIAYQVLD